MNYLSTPVIALAIIGIILTVGMMGVYRAEPGYIFNNTTKYIYYLIFATLSIGTVSLVSGIIVAYFTQSKKEHDARRELLKPPQQ
jgi:ABC-type Mn2+/Zn2+ transport system permease subunit